MRHRRLAPLCLLAALRPAVALAVDAPGADMILTDSPSYDPNGQVGNGTWTPLQEEK